MLFRSRQLARLELVFENENCENEESTLETMTYEEKLTEVEERITIDLLMDKIEDMEGYITELLDVISNSEKRTNEQITELKLKNQEYKEAIVQIRNFIDEEQEQTSAREEQKQLTQVQREGHNLLRRNKKVLVLGNTLSLTFLRREKNKFQQSRLVCMLI